MAKCVGCGLEVNNGILEVAIAGDETNPQTNSLTCTDDGNDPGLAVKLCPNGGVVVDSCGLKIQFPPNTDGGPGSIIPFGNCIGTDAEGKVNVKLGNTPASCNGLECKTDGLYTPCEQHVMEINQLGIGPASLQINAQGAAQFDFIGTPVGNNTQGFWNVCNPFCCGAARGLFIVEASGPVVDNMSNNFLANLVYLFDDGMGGPTNGIFPEHVQWFDNRGGPAGRRESVNLWHETFKVFEGSLPNTGSCFTYRPRFRFRVFSGTATVRTDLANGGFELHTHMHQSDNFAGTINKCHTNDCVIAPPAPLNAAP